MIYTATGGICEGKTIYVCKKKTKIEKFILLLIRLKNFIIKIAQKIMYKIDPYWDVK